MAVDFKSDYQAFVSFAREASKTNERQVAHVNVLHNAEGGARQLTVCRAGTQRTVRDSVYSLFRSDEAKTANAYARTCFERAIAGLYGGSNKIPASVRAEMTNFGTNHPLTARRILKISNAIDATRVNTDPNFKPPVVIADRCLRAFERTQMLINQALAMTDTYRYVGSSVKNAISQLMTRYHAPLHESIVAGRPVFDADLIAAEEKVRLDVARLLGANGLTGAAKILVGEETYVQHVESDIKMLQVLIAAENPDLPVRVSLPDGDESPTDGLCLTGAPRDNKQSLLLAVLEKLATKPSSAEEKEVFCCFASAPGRFCRVSLAEALGEVVGTENIRILDISKKTTNFAALFKQVLGDECRVLSEAVKQKIPNFRQLDLDGIASDLSEHFTKLYNNADKMPSVSIRQVVNLVRLNLMRELVVRGYESALSLYLGKDELLSSGFPQEYAALRLMASQREMARDDAPTYELSGKAKGFLQALRAKDYELLLTRSDSFVQAESPYREEPKVFIEIRKESCGLGFEYETLQVALPETLAKEVVARGCGTMKGPFPAAPDSRTSLSPDQMRELLREECGIALGYLTIHYNRKYESVLPPHKETHGYQHVDYGLRDLVTGLQRQLYALLQKRPSIQVSELRQLIRLNLARGMAAYGMEGLASAYLGGDKYVEKGFSKRAIVDRLRLACDEKLEPEMFDESSAVTGESRTVEYNRMPVFVDEKTSRMFNEVEKEVSAQHSIMLQNGQKGISVLGCSDVTRLKEILEGRHGEPEEMRFFEHALACLKVAGLVPVELEINPTMNSHELHLMLRKPLRALMTSYGLSFDVSSEKIFDEGLKAVSALQVNYARMIGISLMSEDTVCALDGKLRAGFVARLRELGVEDSFEGYDIQALKTRYITTLRKSAEALDTGVPVVWRGDESDEAVVALYQERKKFVENRREEELERTKKAELKASTVKGSMPTSSAKARRRNKFAHKEERYDIEDGHRLRRGEDEND